MARGSKPGERRGGRKKGTPNKTNSDIRELARQYGPQAIAALVRALDDPGKSVAAATVLLDRGYGKAPQPVTGEGGEGAAKFEITWLPSES